MGVNREARAGFSMDLLTEDPILACPDFEAKFVLQTDARKYGIGAVLPNPSTDKSG